MKTLKIIVVFLFFVSCSAQKQALKISDDICNQNIEFYKNKKAKISEKRANQIRKELIRNEKLNFISLEEFLYIIEGYDFETGETYTTVWNNKGEISFKSSKKSYQIENQLFSEELKGIISNWKLNEIKKLTKERGTLIGGLDMNVFKIYVNKNGETEYIKRFSFEQYVEND